MPSVTTLGRGQGTRNSFKAASISVHGMLSPLSGSRHLHSARPPFSPRGSFPAAGTLAKGSHPYLVTSLPFWVPNTSLIPHGRPPSSQQSSRHWQPRSSATLLTLAKVSDPLKVNLNMSLIQTIFSFVASLQDRPSAIIEAVQSSQPKISPPPANGAAPTGPQPPRAAFIVYALRLKTVSLRTQRSLTAYFRAHDHDRLRGDR